MLLDFQRGDSSRPKGHALAYYRDSSGAIHATYLIIPPIAIDLAKYMPPMFSQQVSLADAQSIAAVPLPPVPEKVDGGIDYLRSLADARDDDMVFMGTMNSVDVQSVLVQVTDAAQEYLRIYRAFVDTLPKGGQPALEEKSSDTGVQDVLYSMMSERDRLAELAKLVGKLRYAIDGRDQSLSKDTLTEMQALAAHLPAKYRVEDITRDAQLMGDKGRRLSELRLNRCYKICDEDYRAVETLDAQIRAVESQP
ncbi:MAG: hypothetical protein HY261_06565 [Chloroflexi bacterium]|nr:hypothetical protein [Chloroflexota bacterium]